MPFHNLDLGEAACPAPFLPTNHPLTSPWRSRWLAQSSPLVLEALVWVPVCPLPSPQLSPSRGSVLYHCSPESVLGLAEALGARLGSRDCSSEEQLLSCNPQDNVKDKLRAIVVTLAYSLQTPRLRRQVPGRGLPPVAPILNAHQPSTQRSEVSASSVFLQEEEPGRTMVMVTPCPAMPISSLHSSFTHSLTQLPSPPKQAPRDPECQDFFCHFQISL